MSHFLNELLDILRPVALDVICTTDDSSRVGKAEHLFIAVALDHQVPHRTWLTQKAFALEVELRSSMPVELTRLLL